MFKLFFDISTGFRVSKMKCGSVPSIPVAVLVLLHVFSRCQLDDSVFQGRLVNLKCQLLAMLHFSFNWLVKFAKLRPLWERLGSS